MLLRILAGAAFLALAAAGEVPHRARDMGIAPGVLQPGPLNAITDVGGTAVGQVTVWQGEAVRTGVTAILPHPGNVFQEKVPAAVFVGNGFGKLAGGTQVEELGNLETPVVLTNTLSVAEGVAGIVDFILSLPGNELVRSVNAVVGETNDGWLSDIRGRHVTRAHVLEAIRTARGGPVAEGTVGAGTGTVCFGYKGGIGTASRRLPDALQAYTVGVLVQTNFGGILEILGAPIGRELGRYYLKEHAAPAPDGSCMIVIATDAPLEARNLKRLAARAVMALVRTGSSMSNGSGDYAIAFSTASACRIPANPAQPLLKPTVLHNDALSPLFQAVIEATEEAIYNSLVMAWTVSGRDGNTAEALPIEAVVRICRSHGVLRGPR